MSKHKIAIIGAGVSGLAAAVQLLERSGQELDITIYEARREPGGRTRSYLDVESGDELDNGQHLLMACYHETLDYCRQIGSMGNLKIQKRLSIPFWIAPEQRLARLDIPSLPAPLSFIAGVLKTSLLSRQEKLGALSFGSFLRKANPRALMTMTCSDLFRKHRQPEGAIQKLWEPIVLAAMNAPIRIASAAVFVHTLRLIFLGSRRDASLAFPTVGLGALLIRPAIDHLERNGVTIRLGTPIEAIVKSPSGFELHSLDRVHEAEVVVVSSPLDSVPMPIELPSTSTSPIVNAYFWLDEVVQPSPILGHVGTTLQWSFAHASRSAAQRIALTVSAADALVQKDASAITDILWREFIAAFPGSTARLLRSQIIKEKRATVLLDPATQRARPSARTDIRGLYLAGDIVQNMLPATIEGAVRNGRTAARMLMEDFSITAK